MTPHWMSASHVSARLGSLSRSSAKWFSGSPRRIDLLPFSVLNTVPGHIVVAVCFTLALGTSCELA